MILFGEYTIIKGSQALASPLMHFSGNWEYTATRKKADALQQSLPAFWDYIVKLKEKGELLCDIDTDNFREKLSEGLYFDSTIPTGYGVGSSGALCAAVYDAFARDKFYQRKASNLKTLQSIFAQLESFFHEPSSGIDPLISYVNKPLLIPAKKEGKESMELIKKVALQAWGEKNEHTLFLLDTGIQRKTGPLVQLFLKKCKDTDFENRCQKELAIYSNEAIEAFLNDQPVSFYKAFHNISQFQYFYFSEMIPEACKPSWQYGMKNDLFKLKLCGAGGGGFLLGISRNFKKTCDKLSPFPLIKIGK